MNSSSVDSYCISVSLISTVILCISFLMHLQNVDLRQTSIGSPRLKMNLWMEGRLCKDSCACSGTPAELLQTLLYYVWGWERAQWANGNDHEEASYSSSNHIYQNFSNLCIFPAIIIIIPFHSQGCSRQNSYLTVASYSHAQNGIVF